MFRVQSAGFVTPPPQQQPATPTAHGSVRPLTAARWFDNDDLAGEIGRHLERLDDVDHFEQALGRALPGLYANLYGGSVHRLMAPERATLRGQLQALPAPVPNDLPNWEDRYLLHRGLAPATSPAAARVFALDDALAGHPAAATPLGADVRRRAQEQMSSFRSSFARHLAPFLAQMRRGAQQEVTLPQLNALARDLQALGAHYALHLQRAARAGETFAAFIRQLDHYASVFPLHTPAMRREMRFRAHDLDDQIRASGVSAGLPEGTGMRQLYVRVRLPQ